MANVVEEGGAPSSNIVGGAPTATKTFTMPASVALDVQTVVATIDNSAGATPVTATVTIRDQGGEVIDANAQDDTIPAGGTGTATFARRLAGKSRRATNFNTQAAVYFGNAVSIGSNSSAFLTWDSLQSGADLLDLTNPAQPTTREAGVYAVSAYVRGQMGAPDEGFFVVLEMDAAADDPQVAQDSVQSVNTVLAFVTVTLIYFSPAGGVVSLLADLGTTTGNRDITLWYGNVQRLS